MIKQLSTKIVYQNAWMKVVEDQVEFSNGHTGIYGVVEKTDFALIIPFDGEFFHLVKQYRYPIKKESIEFPQGKHEDNTGEEPESMARAELLEETGLETDNLIHLGFFHEAPGYSSQGFHIYLAKDLTENNVKLDITEVGLERVRMTPQEFRLAVLDNTIVDAPTISAYALLTLKFPKFLTT